MHEILEKPVLCIFTEIYCWKTVWFPRDRKNSFFLLLCLMGTQNGSCIQNVKVKKISEKVKICLPKLVKDMFYSRTGWMQGY